MNRYTNDKPFIGSLFELAWACEDPDKLVIGLFDGSPKLDTYCGHPFIQNVVHIWRKTEAEVVNVIHQIFGE